VTLQDLNAEVSHTDVDTNHSGGVETGYVSEQGAGNTASFAGISTQTNSTGIANVNQSVTAVSASTSIQFGGAATP
jgi:hypothetical protein